MPAALKLSVYPQEAQEGSQSVSSPQDPLQPTVNHEGSRVVSLHGKHPTIAPPSQPSSLVTVLSCLNRGAIVAAIVLVAATLGSYGYLVSIERQLDRTTRRLEGLERSERQLTTINEVLKNHLAEQAELPNAGLQPPQPANMIFLKLAPSRPQVSPSTSGAPFQRLKMQIPLGY